MLVSNADFWLCPTEPCAWDSYFLAGILIRAISSLLANTWDSSEVKKPGILDRNQEATAMMFSSYSSLSWPGQVYQKHGPDISYLGSSSGSEQLLETVAAHEFDTTRKKRITSNQIDLGAPSQSSGC